ncbi:unnamed protein product [Macrosiphum euphorbiae]|nr:unnamed protein product [Macrosiphum euphorbiae]
MLPRLTDQHIVRDKIAKMKVKYVTQVFSQRVSSTMNFLASRNIIGTDAADTAFICLFFDKLFDSLNGSFDKVTDGKIYRTAVKKNSIHHTVWAESLKVLSTMSFVLENGRKKSVPTIQNWMTTIRSFKTLSKLLDLNGIRSFLPRHLNQDPLECFFGAIRSIGSKNPNCHAFDSAYKTLVLNNLVSTHSPGSSCEEDFTEGSLSSFKNFFESAIASTSDFENQIVISADLPPTLHNLSMTTSFVRGQAQNYIAGFIVKKLNKTFFKNCQTCLTQLCTEKVSEHHSLITAREYQSNHPTLKYPTSTLCSIVQQIISFVGEKMSNVCLHPNIHSTLTNALNQQLIFPFELNCSEHKDLFRLNIIKFTVKMMIQHYCTEVNRILLGKRKLQDNETDPVKKLAYTWYLKHSKTRKTQGKFNLI